MSWGANGIFSTGMGNQFVIDCVSGDLIPRANARYIGYSKKYGGHFWIKLDADINDARDGQLFPSQPREEAVR